MFNLQGGELVIIALLALVVLGPEKLPEAMRHVGRLMRQMRGVRDTFQREFKQALDEPMRDLRRATTGSADELRRAAKSMVEPESDSTSEDAAAASASGSEAPVADDASKVTAPESVAEPVSSPDAPATETAPRQANGHEAERRGNTVAYILIALGFVFLLANLGAFRFVQWSITWPLIVIAIGVLLLVQRTRP